ncbi:MAG: hypothetical protein M2R45_00467 [Verrucomicrobia subdivision 3 bacterium]|nr:hypothetical protein [Limisphaerales bacterium]MCS1413653.1 hypothetical protein [Limisphaerales bacterium]
MMRSAGENGVYKNIRLVTRLHNSGSFDCDAWLAPEAGFHRKSNPVVNRELKDAAGHIINIHVIGEADCRGLLD